MPVSWRLFPTLGHKLSPFVMVLSHIGIEMGSSAAEILVGPEEHLNDI